MGRCINFLCYYFINDHYYAELTFSVLEDRQPGDQAVIHEVVGKLFQLGTLVQLHLLPLRTPHLKVCKTSARSLLFNAQSTAKVISGQDTPGAAVHTSNMAGLFLVCWVTKQYLPSGRPDMTFTVDWALKTNYLPT